MGSLQDMAGRRTTCLFDRPGRPPLRLACAVLRCSMRCWSHLFHGSLPACAGWHAQGLWCLWCWCLWGPPCIVPVIRLCQLRTPELFELRPKHQAWQTRDGLRAGTQQGKQVPSAQEVLLLQTWVISHHCQFPSLGQLAPLQSSVQLPVSFGGAA
jgi:hypothetical protein